MCLDPLKLWLRPMKCRIKHWNFGLPFFLTQKLEFNLSSSFTERKGIHLIRLCEITWMDSTHGCRTRHYYLGHILNTASHSAISHRHLCSNVTAREKGWEGDKVCPRKEKRTFCPKPAGLAWEWNGILGRGDLFTWALSQNTCPRCHSGVWDAVCHRKTQKTGELSPCQFVF